MQTHSKPFDGKTRKKKQLVNTNLTTQIFHSNTIMIERDFITFTDEDRDRDRNR